MHFWAKTSFSVIVNYALSDVKEERLLKVLKEHKVAMGWGISDIKRISPSICMYKILMEDTLKPIVQPQRRLNLTMQEVVHKELLKLLDTEIIYPIFNSAWVSLVQVVPKKGDIIVASNKNNELIPTRMVTRW